MPPSIASASSSTTATIENRRTRVVTPAEMARRAELIAAFVRHGELRVRRILDAGCGLGLMRAPLLERLPGARYTGLEASPYLCERYGWEQGSLANWTHRRPFDLVVCYDVLQYLDARDAAAAIRRLGRLCSGVLHFGALTLEDWREYCDRRLTDRAVHLRSADWYLSRLRPGLRECGVRHVRPAGRSPASLGARAAAPAADPPWSEDEVRPRHRPARLTVPRSPRGAARDGTIRIFPARPVSPHARSLPAVVTRRITDAHAHGVQFDTQVRGRRRVPAGRRPAAPRFARQRDRKRAHGAAGDSASGPGCQSSSNQHPTAWTSRRRMPPAAGRPRPHRQHRVAAEPGVWTGGARRSSIDPAKHDSTERPRPPARYLEGGPDGPPDAVARADPDTATQRDIYDALSIAVREELAARWLATQRRVSRGAASSASVISRWNSCSAAP